MLIKRQMLGRIAAGEVTLVFRRWGKAQVRAGGQLRTAAGVLAIDAVDVVGMAEIADEDAVRAGFGTRDALLRSLEGPAGEIFRVTLRYLQDDPRTALAADDTFDDKAARTLRRRLAAIDARSPRGAWTLDWLRLIADAPGVAAGELAERIGAPKPLFKAGVSRLKEFGLTESLPLGYRVSPRGARFLEWIAAQPAVETTGDA